MNSYAKKEKEVLPSEMKKATAAAVKEGLSNYSVASGLGGGSAMPAALQNKMGDAFGADFSNVVIHESPVVEQYGADAAAFGNHIAFAPGKYDPDSISGQGLIGHELSHVVQQARGEANGSGYLADSSLEARADLQGAMAARGESASQSLDGQSLSIQAMSPGTSAPCQASKKDRKAFDVALPNIPADILKFGRDPNQKGEGDAVKKYSDTLVGMHMRGDDMKQKKSAEEAYRKMHNIPAMIGKKVKAAGITDQTFEKYQSMSRDELSQSAEYATDAGRMHDIEGSAMGDLMDEPDMQKLIRAKYQGFQGLSDKARAGMGGESGIMGALLSDMQNRMTGFPLAASRKNMAKASQGGAVLQTSITAGLLNVANGRDFNELNDDELQQSADYVNKKMTFGTPEGGTGETRAYADVARIKQQMALYNKLRAITGSGGAGAQAPQAAPAAPAKKKRWKLW